ncbi:MAG: helix-turn-helix transcriptional regulator [Candidatus Wallacebacter cryptica]|nr:helix-turn-helix domain-containing protein [Bacillota bacterium]
MKELSTTTLARTIKNKREEKGLTQEGLSNLTGINRAIISRIEREDFIPSIYQLQALGRALEFDITSMFLETQENNAFIALRSQALSEKEKEGVERLFKMMIVLRQQILLRRKFENEARQNP